MLNPAPMLGVRSSGLIVGAACLIGCAAESSIPAERVGRTASPIINGTSSTTDQDFVVQLGLDTSGVVAAQCTASVVAKNLIVTARHCVGEVSSAGNTMVGMYTADRLVVYVGYDGPQQIDNGDRPAARGKRVFTPPGKSMLPDLAFVLLDQDVKAPIAKIRLHAPAKKDERVDVVGFGMNEDNQNATTRMQKTGVKVLALAPQVTAYHSLNAGEFAFGEAACYGDSGGPALSAETNAIVGIASRVNSGTTATDDNPAQSCMDAEDVYTTFQPFRALVDEAFAAAGAKPLLEAEARPSGEKAKTTQSAGIEKGDEDYASFWDSPDQAKAGGCSTSPSRHGSTIGGIALALGLLAAARRRRSN